MTSRLTATGTLKPERLGVKQASTFLGFCNKHDTEMFRPIETGLLPLDAQTAFLLSFRATAYELFEKRAALRGLQGLRVDAGRSLMDQERIVNQLLPSIVSLELPVADYTAWKEKLDAAFLAQNFSELLGHGLPPLSRPSPPEARVVTTAANPLMAAIESFEAAEANLVKLERLWAEMEGLIPVGVSFGPNPEYEILPKRQVKGLAALDRRHPTCPDVSPAERGNP